MDEQPIIVAYYYFKSDRSMQMINIYVSSSYEFQEKEMQMILLALSHTGCNDQASAASQSLPPTHTLTNTHSYKAHTHFKSVLLTHVCAALSDCPNTCLIKNANKTLTFLLLYCF